MAAVVGTVPLSLAIGTGVGTPATYAVAGVILLCFAVGYAAMGRRVVSGGGFYAYISQGLGRIPAVGGASIAVLSYNVLTVGLIAAFGYFSNIAVGCAVPARAGPAPDQRIGTHADAAAGR
jgi:amino acid transporter